MTTFDRHTAARLIKTFLLFVGALVLFFIVLHWVEYSDDFLDGGATVGEVFGVFYPSYIPEIVRLISPLAIFLATIYVTSTLAQELQLIALQTTGVSLYRLMMPYAAVGLVLSVGMFAFNGWVVPRANETVVRYEDEYLHPERAGSGSSEVHRQNGPHSILSVGYYNTSDSVGYEVSLQRFADSTRMVARLDASRMVWVDSTRRWRFERTVRRTFAGGAITRTELGSVDTTLTIYPRDLARSANKVEAMTLPAARDYLAAMRRAGVSNLGRSLVAYYTKFAYPWANLILVLLGVPLASVRRRGGQAVQFGIGLLVAFVYLAVQKLSAPLGYTGAAPPVLVAWLPHVVFAVVAVVVIARTRT